MAAACTQPTVTTARSDISNNTENLGDHESTVVVLTTETNGEENDTAVQIQTMTLLESAVKALENGSSDQVIEVIPMQDENGQEIQIIQMQPSNFNQTTDVIHVYPKEAGMQDSQRQDQGNTIYIQELTPISLLECGSRVPEKKSMTIKKEPEEADLGKAVIEDGTPVRRSGRLPARRRTIPSKFRDYRNPDSVDEDNANDDEDFSPELMAHPDSKMIHTYSKGKRGRPRKYPHLYDLHTKVIPTAVVTEMMEVEPSTSQPDLTTVRPDLTSEEGDSVSHCGQAEVQVETSLEAEVRTAAEDSEQYASEDTMLLGPEGGKGDGQTDKPETQPVKEMPQVKEAPRMKKVNTATQVTRSFIPSILRASKSIIAKCPTCSKVFSSKGNMKTHMLIHAGLKPFPCDILNCSKMFRSNETLRRHKLAHMGIKSFQCSFCSNKFSSSVSLQEHMCRHTDARPHQCNVCLRSFRQISCLRRHLVTHSSDLPYTCQVCGKKFSTTIYLKSHTKTHTGEKPFKCSECGKAFSHQSDVSRHKIIHSGTRPFECDVCHAKFSDPSSKRRHEREHVGVKPYTCQLCSDSFKRAGQLKAHLSRKHTNEKDEVSVIRAENGEIQFIFKDGTNLVPDIPKSDKSVNSSSLTKQKKIVKLIKDLNSSMVQHVQINLPSQDYSEGNPTPTESQEQLTSVETVVMEAFYDKPRLDTVQEGIIIQDLGQVSSDGELQHIVMDQGVEVQTMDEKDQRVIKITEVSDILQSAREQAEVPVEYLQIIEELAPDSLEQQIVEVHYQESDTPPGPAPPVNQNEKKDNMVTSPMVPVEGSPVTGQQSGSVSLDYVSSPDFSSQQYYNWLSSFTELCKVVPMPLDMSLFQKISQVHKTLSDVMATPSGIIADKENFKILMNICKELNTIINEHLCFVMQNLDRE